MAAGSQLNAQPKKNLAAVAMDCMPPLAEAAGLRIWQPAARLHKFLAVNCQIRSPAAAAN